MLCAVNWLLSLETAPPLLLDGVSIHPLVGHAFVDRTFDALDAAGDGDLVLLDVEATGPGRARATVANLGAGPRLLLQGDELQHGDDAFELATPLLLAPDGAIRVELRRAASGVAPSRPIQERLRRLQQFALPPGTVGYLATRGDELVRAELFAGPLTCRHRWGWAVGSVLGQADARQRPARGAAAATELLRRLAAACRSGSWVEAAASVAFGVKGQRSFSAASRRIFATRSGRFVAPVVSGAGHPAGTAAISSAVGAIRWSHLSPTFA